jgi:hypothetical protein
MLLRGRVREVDQVVQLAPFLAESLLRQSLL